MPEMVKWSTFSLDVFIMIRLFVFLFLFFCYLNIACSLFTSGTVALSSSWLFSLRLFGGSGGLALLPLASVHTHTTGGKNYLNYNSRTNHKRSLRTTTVFHLILLLKFWFLLLAFLSFLGLARRCFWSCIIVGSDVFFNRNIL